MPDSEVIKLNYYFISIFALACLFFYALLPVSFAYADPGNSEDAHTVFLTSSHFVVKFPDNAHAYGQRAIDYAEYAYNMLSQRLQTELDHKIVIQLIDTDLDEHYSAYGDEDDFILIYLWPPQNVLDNAYQGNWLENQISAYIARLLIQRTSSDFIHAYNNMYLPTWYLDGLAQYFIYPSQSGRQNNHSSLFRAIVNDSVVNDRMLDLGRWTTGQVNWLGQKLGKVYGTEFISSLANEYGENSLVKWTHFNGSEFTSMNRIAQKTFGWDWYTLSGHWQNKLKTAMLSHHNDEIESEHVTDAWKNELPQVVPGRKALSYVRDDGIHPKSIVLLDLDTMQEKELVECLGRCEHHWSPDGQTLYFTYLIQNGRYYSETLHSLEISGIFPHRIQSPGHIRSFAVGSECIYIVTLSGDKPEIYQIAINHQEQVKRVYTGQSFELVEDLVMLDKGLLVASVYWPNARQFDLTLFSDNGHDLNAFRLTDDKVTEKYPFVMPNHHIGFITESNENYILRAVSLNGSGQTILHHQRLPMVQTVQDDNGSLYYTEISSAGMAIAKRSPSQLNSSSLKDAYYQDIIEIPPEADSLFEDAIDKDVWIPYSYSPIFGTSDATGWNLGLGISNHDILGEHYYDAHFAWFFDRKSFDMAINYKWQKYKWFISAGVGTKQKTQTIDFMTEYKYYPYQSYWTTLFTGTSWHFAGLDIDFKTGVLFEYNKSLDDKLDELLESLPDREQFAGHRNPKDMKHLWSNAFIAELELSHVHQADYTIPGKTGYIYNFITRLEPTMLGNKYNTFINISDIQLSWSMPWLTSHVFEFEFKYGFSWSDTVYRYPLEIPCGIGFAFNDEAVFYGIRAGNIIASNHLLFAHAAYTLPVYYFTDKLTRLPIGFNRIGLGVIGNWSLKSDIGVKLDLENAIFGVGGEVYLDLTIGYNYSARLILGYAHGFADYGGDAFYINIGL